MNSAEIFLLILSLSGLLYISLIALFIYGWVKLKPYELQEEKYPVISIVVAARNEAGNVHMLIESLLSQDYPEDRFEIIIVDDHSDDGTADLVEASDKNKRIEMIRLEDGKQGKKNALTAGIQKAGGELIATTDADCLPGQQWLRTIALAYQSTHCKMIAGPVAIREPQTFLEKFQALELLSLVASGAGAIGIGLPIMCNGANLAFNKQAFHSVGGYKGNEHIPGGDDVFLMEKFVKHFSGKAVTFVKDRRAIITTKGAESMIDFLVQRIRWVAKSPAYRQAFMILTALIVLVFNLIILSAFTAALFNLVFLYAGLILLLIKSLIDIILLWMISRFAKQVFLMKFFLVFQLIYIPFNGLMGVIGNIAGYRWKGRQ